MNIRLVFHGFTLSEAPAAQLAGQIGAAQGVGPRRFGSARDGGLAHLAYLLAIYEDEDVFSEFSK